VVARRKGTSWYIAGINGQTAEQEVSLELPFISKDKSLHLITDGTEPGTFSIQSIKTNGKKLTIKIPARGGFVLY
jgi:alpha-glucosidase